MQELLPTLKNKSIVHKKTEQQTTKVVHVSQRTSKFIQQELQIVEDMLLGKH